ncbi:MAG: putative metalloprotease CJM1_0395 family protein, partial [Nitrospinales bacterium]
MEIQSILTGISTPVSSPPKDASSETSSLEEKTDTVRLSSEGQALADGKPATDEPDSEDSEETESETAQNPVAGNQELTDEDKRAVEELKKRDRQVRAHEQAHKAAAGQYAKGGPSFEFQLGPDGRRYAVGGEVKIDASEFPGDPQATILKAQTIRQAANAPADPSAQDRQVAAQ